MRGLSRRFLPVEHAFLAYGGGCRPGRADRAWRAVVPRATATLARLDALAAASVICHTHGNTGDDRNPLPSHHVPELALLPLCKALAQLGILLSPSLAFLAAPAVPTLQFCI